jgi:hypothetical protein
MEILINRLQNFKNININKILFEIFSKPEIQTFLKDLIRIEQLFKEGVSEDNVIIGYYSAFTESLHPEKKEGTHYTLRLTGSFYNSFKISVNLDNIIIDADGEKDDGRNLFEIYNKSGNLLGLTAESKEKLNNKLIPLILAKIRENI